MRLHLVILLISVLCVLPSLVWGRAAKVSKISDYYNCSSNSQCKSGKCAFMGTDYGNGKSKPIKSYTCVPKNKCECDNVFLSYKITVFYSLL